MNDSNRYELEVQSEQWENWWKAVDSDTAYLEEQMANQADRQQYIREQKRDELIESEVL